MCLMFIPERAQFLAGLVFFRIISVFSGFETIIIA